MTAKSVADLKATYWADSAPLPTTPSDYRYEEVLRTVFKTHPPSPAHRGPSSPVYDEAGDLGRIMTMASCLSQANLRKALDVAVGDKGACRLRCRYIPPGQDIVEQRRFVELRSSAFRLSAK